MATKTKNMAKSIIFVLITVMLLAIALTVGAFAEDSLWSQKPESGAVHSGYCIDGDGNKTNIMFEVYSEGTGYTIYFFMEDPNGGSVVYPGSTSGGYVAVDADVSYHLASKSLVSKMAYYNEAAYPTASVTKAVFGDGITELGGPIDARGILTGLTGLTTVEFPASLTKMTSATFISCGALSTVYTRDVGQTVEAGTVNLSNFSHMNFGEYAFSNCGAVQKYVFADTVTTDNSVMGEYCFAYNSALKSMTIPNGITKTMKNMFVGCYPPSQYHEWCYTWALCPIEEITLPATLTDVWNSTFKYCHNLHTVTFLGENTNIYAQGTTKDEIFVINDYGNSFGSCSALTTIKGIKGSSAETFATTYGFEFVEIETPEVELPIDTVTSTCGALIMTYDPNTKTMTVDTNESSWTAFVTAHWWNGPNGSVHCAEPLDFMGKYKNEMEHFVIGSNIDELATGNSTWSSFFDGFTALKTFRFTNPIKLTLGSKGNLFANCTNLTSVYVGDESNAQAGVADLSSFTSCDSGVLMGLFTNCTSLTKVLLPEAVGASSIYSSTFDGCTALETVSIPATVTAIAENAFEDCTALTAIIAPEGSVGYNYAAANGLLPTLWSQKPTDTTNLVHSGYCRDYYGAATNIKFEIYNEGTAEAPSYTMYFFMDDENGSSVVLAGDIGATAEKPAWIYINTYDNGRYGVASNQAYYAPNIYDTQNIHKVVFGDGITALGCSDSATYSGILSGLNKLKTVELPASLKRIYDATFKGNHALTTVYTRDVDQKIAIGTVNLSNLDQVYLGKYAFSGCMSVQHYIFKDVMLSGQHADSLCFNENYGLISLNLPDGLWSVASNAFQNCTALEAIYAPVGSRGHSFAMANGYDTTHYSIFEEADGSRVKLEYFPANQHMSITNVDGSYVELLWDNATVQTFLATYKPYVMTAEVGAIQKIRANSNVEFGLFEGFELLTEVHFESLTLAPYWGCTDVDLFKGCKALTTLWVGDDSNKIDGVINFTGFVNTDHMPAKVLKGMFSGCEAITKVILPDLSNAGYESNGEMVYPTPATIHANTFEGCTALKEIVIPETYRFIEDGAFANLTALRKIELNSDEITVNGSAFEGCTSVIIYCNNASSAKAVNAQLSSDGIEPASAMAFAPAMDILGFQVREKDYNGLRSLFSFNENIWGEDSPFKLVEYGSIIATAENYAKYAETIAEGALLASDGSGSYVTPAKNIVKTAIWNSNTGYQNISDHSNTSAVRFNTTVVKFSSASQYKTPLAMVGYEIWEMNGEYYAFFTKYTDNKDYETVSLFKVTVGALKSEDSGMTLSGGDNPIMNMLLSAEPEMITTDNENVIGMLFADPIESGKYVAFYATETNAAASISDLGLDKATRENLSAAIFGKGVSYALPQLDGVWADYMPERIASIPAGKSFVFITDTHWNNNAKKSTQLIEYVRKATGIENVIFCGDPFDGFSDLNDAQNALTTYAQTNFYDIFGEDGIYVVGNHDVNNTASGGSAELTISDTFLYNATVKSIENKAIFDTDMLAALENITYAEVLNSDGTLAYTADEMKEQAIAWAKMHYHYDNEDEKIRYIVLDTGTNGITQLNTIIGNYTSFMSVQYDWLAETLLSTPADYDIIVLGHQIGESTANNVASRDLFQILSAFKAKTALGTNLTAHSANTLAIMGGSTARTYDFTESTFEGTIFSMNGHWHYDRSWIWQTELGTYGTNLPYSDELALSDDAILSICANRDAMWSPGGDEITMTPGTTTEQSFSVVTITYDGKIVLTRFGAGESKTFIYE